MLNEALSKAGKQQFIGLPITEARQQASQLGMEVVVIQEGMPTPLKNDIRQNRVTFSIQNGRVISFRVG